VSAANIPSRTDESSSGTLSRRWKELASSCVNVFGANPRHAYEGLDPNFRH
jgi:hypothetical protein